MGTFDRQAESPAVASLRFSPVRKRSRLELPPVPSDRRSVLAFSHHKAGSTMFFGILRALSGAAGVNFISIPGKLFRAGIDTASVDVLVDFRETGYCYAGYRFFPAVPMPLLGTAQTTLLVRDPRDVVVSLYFSARESHPLPAQDGELRRRMVAQRENAQATPIDAWVIENHGIVVQALAGYVAQGFASRRNVAIYRYEDIIFRKRAWIEEMLGWYGWKVPASVVDEILEKFDVFPDVADTTKHVRQVAPGNYKVMLGAETQEKLSTCFAPLLKLFGYAP